MSLNTIIKAIRTRDFHEANKAFTAVMQSKVNAQLHEMSKTLLDEELEEAFGASPVCPACKHSWSAHNDEGCSKCKCENKPPEKPVVKEAKATGVRADISRDWRDAMTKAGLRNDVPGKRTTQGVCSFCGTTTPDGSDDCHQCSGGTEDDGSGFGGFGGGSGTFMEKTR